MHPEAAETVSESSSKSSGLTLIEMTLAITVIGISLAGTLLVMNQTTRHSADPMIAEQAVAIAEAYLEEILLKSYYDPDTGAGGGICPAAEGSRDLYDNICDYNGLSDSGAKDQDGSAISDLEDYNVLVTVDTTATLNGLSSSTDVVRIDVQVTNSPIVDVTMTGYRTNY
jgi:MSHA pilin protein MshD